MLLAENSDTDVFFLRLVKTALVFGLFSQVLLWGCKLVIFLAKRVCSILTAHHQAGSPARNHSRRRRQRPT